MWKLTALGERILSSDRYLRKEWFQRKWASSVNSSLLIFLLNGKSNLNDSNELIAIPIAAVK